MSREPHPDSTPVEILVLGALAFVSMIAAGIWGFQFLEWVVNG